MHSMIENFIKFPDLLNKSEIHFDKIGLKEVISNYSFYYISESISFEEKDKQNIKKSKIIIFSQSQKLDKEINNKHILISFENTMIILKQSPTSASFISNVLSTNPNMLVCFLQSKNSILTEKIDIKNQEIELDSNFTKEITSFRDSCSISSDKNIKKVWALISPCIFGYLIKKSFLQPKKLRRERFIFDIENNFQPKTIDEKEYVELRSVGLGSLFQCILIYHIKLGELLIVKKPIGFDIELSKLIQREAENYSKINYPLLPKYYGRIKGKGYVVIEYIEGKTLDKMDRLLLTFEEKLNIIFELMLILNYFHNNEMIYRDLKPNNIMITENKTVVLIDFDRLIESDTDVEEQTLDLNTPFFIAPEIIQTHKYTFKNDIYSLGKIIKYLFNQTESKNIQKNKNQSDEYPDPKINQIFDKCIDLIADNRPSILELIYDFCEKFEFEVNLDGSIFKYNEHFYYDDIVNQIFEDHLNEYENFSQFDLGTLYLKGIYVKRNINKAIFYLSLSADQNHLLAQIKLGTIYLEGKYISRDISKAINYLKLAANQNNSDAQYKLGIIYYSDLYIAPDISKALYFFTLAANQNNSYAQFFLGDIYYTRDINKAIHFFSLAAKNNNPDALYRLGLMYIKGQYVSKDINKAISYITQAANKNIPEAQIKLGQIYFEGRYVPCDIIKSIHYYELASEQNFSIAYFNLGIIYLYDQHIERDIDKGIHYLSLAADQNYPDAQFELGRLYYESKYVSRDFNKAMHFFKLAADQNFANALCKLGIIYYRGLKVEKDIDKAVHYLSLASNQNNRDAQYHLGLIHYYEEGIYHDAKKGSYYIMLASESGARFANFSHGFLLHEGKSVKRNITEAIHFYKEASSFNISYAKNNLGIIYKHGFGDEVEKNIGKSVEYFKEATRNKNDCLSMYNLAHLYIYEDNIKVDIYESIDLLIKASRKYSFSINLLSLFLVKIFGFDIDKIKDEIEKRTEKHSDLPAQIIQQMCDSELFDQNTFEKKYIFYQEADFLYDGEGKFIMTSELQNIEESENTIKNVHLKNISPLFYEGFGNDLFQ